MGFVDKEKFEALQEKLEEMYLNLGLTVEMMQTQIDDMGEPHLIVMARVRETAYERLTKDKDAQAAYNKMMAEQNEANLEHRKSAIAKALESGSIFDALAGETVSECSHEHQHEGLCLDCGEELE